LKILQLSFVFLYELVFQAIGELVKHGEGIVEYAVWGEGCLQVHHFFWFVNEGVDPSPLGGLALCCQVANFITIVALAWRSVCLQVQFNLYRVPLGLSVALVWSAGLIAHVYWYWHIVHPVWSV